MAVQFLDSKLSRMSKISAAPLKTIASYQSIGVVVALVEAAMINFCSALGKVGYEGFIRGSSGDGDRMLAVGILASIVYISAAQSAGLYRLPSLIRPVKYLASVAAVSALVLLTLTAVLFLLKVGSSVSRGGMIGFAALMLILSGLTRLAVARVIDRMLKRNLIAGRPAMLIGEADELASITSDYILRQFGLVDVGRVVIDRTEGRPGKRAAQIQEAATMARLLRAKEFVVAVRGDQTEPLNDISDGLRKLPLPVSLLPNSIFRKLMSCNGGRNEASIQLIDLQRAPMSFAELSVKRAVDISVSLFALLVLTPLFIASAFAIKFDSAGPVIFRQRRNGFNQNQFFIFKFRTMYTQEDGTKIVQAQRRDARVTRVGRFLRRTSIDELPQFINVLKGEMSIVGPRPHALAHDDEYKTLISDYYKRHHVKPGITGWAQVNGSRGETSRPRDMEDRIDYDVWYINNWSLLLDLKILLKTCLEVAKHDAY